MSADLALVLGTLLNERAALISERRRCHDECAAGAVDEYGPHGCCWQRFHPETGRALLRDDEMCAACQRSVQLGALIRSNGARRSAVVRQIRRLAATSARLATQEPARV